MRIATSRSRRQLRSAGVALARLFLAFVVVAGIVHSGGRYFYCDALGLSSSDPCASHSSSGRPSCPTEALRPRSVDCCEIVTLASTPEAARTVRPSVAPAGVLAVVAAGSFADWLQGAEMRSRRLALARWRPPPRPSVERLAQRMVFLT